MPDPSASLRANLRERAAETFEKLGWPTTRIEEWRYTNLAPVQKIAWRTDDAGAAAASAAETTFTMAGRATSELIFVNGRLVRQSGTAAGAAAAPTTIADWERNAMVALNTANAQDGARIEIPANAIVEGFIH